MDDARDADADGAEGDDTPGRCEERYLVIDGRRWRRSDPALPEHVRVALVAELMAARRAVRAAAHDETAMRRARRRVDVAKRALGERGPVWWDRPNVADVSVRIEALLEALGPTSGFAWSDADLAAASHASSLPDGRSLVATALRPRRSGRSDADHDP